MYSLISISLINCLFFRCSPPFTGDRCELIEKTDVESTTEKLVASCLNLAPSGDEFSQSAYVAVICLGVLSATLSIAVIYLGARVWQLSNNSRSRRKRRVLVHEKSLRSADRVINIEDCCNMNICETVSDRFG